VTEDELLTASEAAQLTGVSRRTILNWINAEILPARRLPGGHHRIRTADVLELVPAPPSTTSLRAFREARSRANLSEAEIDDRNDEPAPPVRAERDFLDLVSLHSPELDRGDVAIAVDAVLEAITDALRDGESVDPGAFGEFAVEDKPARRKETPDLISSRVVAKKYSEGGKTWLSLNFEQGTVISQRRRSRS